MALAGLAVLYFSCLAQMESTTGRHPYGGGLASPCFLPRSTSRNFLNGSIFRLLMRSAIHTQTIGVARATMTAIHMPTNMMEPSFSLLASLGTCGILVLSSCCDGHIGAGWRDAWVESTVRETMMAGKAHDQIHRRQFSRGPCCQHRSFSYDMVLCLAVARSQGDSRLKLGGIHDFKTRRNWVC